MTERGNHRYEADIRWTTHGVAHIRANDWGSLGYGQGWACARDHLPTLADQLVKVRSERARWNGAGVDGRHLHSDLGYRMLGVQERAPMLRDAQPATIREFVAGYATGANAWIAEAAGTDALPTWCRDAPWVAPFDEIDLWTYLVDVVLMASGRNLAEIIGSAEAPGPDGPAPAAPASALGGGAGASNGWAFGSDATASGHGLVVANPHFPWGGEARFWECHLTLPGELDAYGVCLIGAPGIQIGFNRDVAWTHTFSKGHRFTLDRLDLVPGSPTSYRSGDEERAMEPTELTVEVRGDDGTVAPVTRTRWRTHHGPMVNLPLLGWGLDTAFTYRDANLENVRYFEQFFGMACATSLDELQRVHAEVQGIPWVNTIAADRTGRAWIIDSSPTPALTPAAEARFLDRLQTDLVAALLHENRVAMLDGSDPDDDWQHLDGARSPGLLPYERLPQLERRDYVLNANDSHWLNHATAKVEGHSPLHGLERTPRTLRTRQNLRTVAALAATGEVTTERALEALLSNASLSGELLAGAVAERAAAAGSVEVDGRTLDLEPAAAVLAAWDRTCSLEARGAALWRELMGSFDPKAALDAGPLFAEPFDVDRPVDTPAGLAPAPAAGPDPVLVALGRAVLVLEAAGVPIDAPLGEVQWAQRGAERVPVHGGCELDGVCNILSPWGALASASLEPDAEPLGAIAPDRAATTGIAEGGYRVTYGASFVMAVELTDEGPQGVGLLAYGQCGDDRSPHHVDGTQAYSARQVRPLLFDDAAIAADPNLVHRTITG